MNATSKESIFEDVMHTLQKLSGDWEYDDEITAETYLVADIGLESIDIVVLATTIQNKHTKNLPFAQFFATVGQRELRDIRVDEFVEFIYQHLNGVSTAPAVPSCIRPADHKVFC